MLWKASGGTTINEKDVYALVVTRNLASGLGEVKHALAVRERIALLEGDASAKSIDDGTSRGGEDEGKDNEGCLHVHCK